MLKALIFTNIGVFVLQNLTQGRLTMQLSLGADNIRAFEIWRLGTHMFAHGGFGHIAFNMWALYVFGQPLEDRIGGSRFLNLYFFSGLIGGGTWLLFNWHSPIPVIGASGAVFGIMMASAMLFPNRMYMLMIPPIPMRLKTLAVVFAVIESISLLSRSGGRIAHLAHLGGMVGGYLYMRWAFPGLSSGGLKSLFSSFTKPRPPRPPGEGFRRVMPDEPDEPREEVVSTAEVDRILDKIGKQGISSLTRQERESLERARQRFRKH